MKPCLPAVLVILNFYLLASLAGAADSREPDDTGWAVYLDNDALKPRYNDRDYTSGFSLTRSGRDVADDLPWLETPRHWLDGLFGLQRPHQRNGFTRHSHEIGITTFTPEDLDNVAAQADDRPYANLIYISQSEAEIDEQQELAYLSTLTVGVLGLDWIAEAQTQLHEAMGVTDPKGWRNQISDGGEPTFRYRLARTSRIWQGDWLTMQGDSTMAVAASVGYLSQLTFGMAARFGELRSPWWSHNPQLADYAEKAVPVAASRGGDEQYFWAGFSLHLRLYNAFLQGQFRDSEITYRASELEPVVAEAWLGYTVSTESGWRFSYVLRAMSSEIKSGQGDRSLIWGGLMIGKHY